MTAIVVDVEADGPAPGLYSMVCFGAVVVEPGLSRTFYGTTRPITDIWVPEALAVSGFSRGEHETFDEPSNTMRSFASWVNENAGKGAIFYSDNNGFDWQFINYYFWRFYGSNPFGFSSQNIGSLYKGMRKDHFASFKHLRRTKHDHHPVNDAMGNAEALLEMRRQGMRIPTR